MRMLDECYAEIKKLDPDTAISKNHIRQLALSGKIPVVMVGRKRLINLDGLIEYISDSGNTPYAADRSAINPIRRIV